MQPNFFLKTVSVFILMLVSIIVPSSEALTKNNTVSEIQAKYSRLPLLFIQNEGQADKNVKFYGKQSGYAVFFTGESVNLVLGHGAGNSGQETKDSELIKFTPLNANKDIEVIVAGKQVSKVNYFIGMDPKKWKSNIPTYKTVAYKDVYPGIDMKFYGNNRQLEYDIIVKPGADPYQVKFLYEGIEGLKVTENGDLEVALKHGNLIQKRPYIYQEINGKRVEIEGRCKLLNTKNDTSVHSQLSYGFDIASYNKNYPIIIDPILVYSTFLGGKAPDYGYDIAVDGAGNSYIAGYTESDDFPVVSPLYKSHSGDKDIFVTKIDASGSSIVYSTFLGGKASDYGYGIAVDDDENAYITGYTGSDNFPTSSPIDGIYAEDNDIFITKINASGTSLAYSTYLGGNGFDHGYDIAVDNAGNAYITGYTESTDFFTVSPIQKDYGGGKDAFVTKINASGTSLVYSTYLGGNSWDSGKAIAVDVSGNAYVTGYTGSYDFPLASPLNETNASSDAFVTKINASGSAIVYSTYLGGRSWDSANDIAVDSSGNAYIAGYTESSNFPASSAIDETYGNFDAFVTKIDASGSAIVYSTYLGGDNGKDEANGIAVDSHGNAYITGYSGSNNFPAVYSIYEAYKGDYDAFTVKIGKPLPRYSLTLNKNGAGAGTVRGKGGIDCGSICTGSFNEGATVTMNAVPDSGSDFKGWSGGGCRGTGDCTVTIDADTAVTAIFSKTKKAVVNRPPSPPKLVYPKHKQTSLPQSITFIWKRSSDPDGDSIVYNFYYCNNPEFKNCGPIIVASSTSFGKKTILYGSIAGSWTLLLIGLLLSGIINKERGRRVVWLLIIMLGISMFLAACKRKESDNKPPQPPTPAKDEIGYAVSGLSNNATYFWRVIAKDGKGNSRKSNIRSFTTRF